MKFTIQIILIIVLYIASTLLTYLNYNFYSFILWYVGAIVVCWFEYSIAQKWLSKYNWLKYLILAQGILFGILKAILYFVQ